MLLQHRPDSLAQTVALLAPEAGEALIPSARRQVLVERCRGLPPLVDGEFEFGLARDEMTTNVKQRMGQGSTDIDVMRRYLAESRAATLASEVAAPLAKLLAAWQNPASPLCDNLLEAWLAYEEDKVADTSVATVVAPALWLGMSQSLISPDERWIAMQITLDILLNGQWRAWREALLRTMVACPPEAFVSHLYIKWERGQPTLRVNVKRLRAQTVARYLDVIAWPGEIETVEEQVARLFRFADHITLRLDVGPAIAPRLGLECMLISQSPTESRWAALLDDLVGRGLCSEGKRDAFLGWAGMTTPLLTDLDWPDRLIVESLTHPATHLSVLQRRFGHITVEVGPEGKLGARGALRFVPQWLKL